MRLLACSLFLLVFLPFAHGQDASAAKAGYVISPRVHYGFFIPHRQGMRSLVTGHVRGVELNIEKQFKRDNAFHQHYRNASFGLSARYLDIGNPDQMGSAIAIAPWTTANLYATGRFSWGIRAHIGIGYITRRWDRVENHQNVAIGSHINAFLAVGMLLDYQLTQQLSANAAFSFNHFSNGAFKTPNLGINLPTASLGVGWRLREDETKGTSISERLNYAERWQTNVMIGGGAKELYPAGGPKYGAMTLALQQQYQLSYKVQFGAQLDGFYNATIQHRVAADEDREPVTSDNYQLGIFVSVQQHMHRFSVATGMGRYLVSQDPDEGPSYHRIFARYSISDHISGTVSLKTHWFSADYVETGIVYHIQKSPWGTE